MTEGAEDRVIALDRAVEGLRIKDVAHGNSKSVMMEGELSCVPYKRGHVVTAFERLFNQLASRAPGGSDYDYLHFTAGSLDA